MPQTTENTTAPEQKASYRIIGKFIHLASAQWLRDGLHSVFLIYLARISTNTFGEFAVAFGLAQITVFLGEFGLNQPLVSALSKKYSSKGDVLAQYSLLKGVLLLSGWLGVLVFINLQGYDIRLKYMVMILSIGVGAEALASSFFVSCRVAGRQDLESRIRALAALLAYGYALGMLYIGADPLLIFCFKLIENGVCLVGAFIVALKRTDFSGLELKRNSLARTWSTAKSGMVFVIMALAAILYNKANIFFLQQNGGASAVAQYSVTWEIVDGASILVSNLLLRGILFPLFVKLWRNDRDEFSRLAHSSVRWLLGASLPVMFVLFVESDRIVTFIYGNQYSEAVWMQKYLVVTVLLSFIHNLSAYLMMSQRRELLLMFIYIFGLLVNLVLCAVLIPANPLLGCVLSIVLTKAVVGAITTVYCQRQMKLIEWRSVWPVLVASLLGGSLYFASSPLHIREISELLAIAPFIWLGLKWRRELKTK